MDLSIFAAKVTGLFFLSLGVGFVSGQFNIKEMLKSMEAPGIRVFGAFGMLVVGGLMVEHHNIWVKDWQVLVTLVGWATLLKGVFFLAFPQLIHGIGDKFVKVKAEKWGYLVILLGLLFGYFGFMM